jgi:hypothetical protein
MSNQDNWLGKQPPRYIFLGMWHEYDKQDDFKKLILPPGISNWQEINIINFIKKEEPIDLLICGPFKCDKTLLILTKYKRLFAGIPKIIINGENPITYTRQKYLWPCIKLVDYVIDFTRHTNRSNPDLPASVKSIHFPIWLWSSFITGVKWLPDNNPVVRLNKGWSTRSQIKTPEFLASCVASHDRNNTRTPIIQEFQKYGQVACPGKLISNYPPIGKGYDTKIEFISRGRFNICSENSAGPGYFTEKIYNALEAGCMPVYWCGGRNQLPIWVNPSAYIHLPDLQTETITNALAKAINSPRPQDLPDLRQTPLTRTAEWEIADCFYQLEFLFYNPAILKLADPPVIHCQSAEQVLVELPAAHLGTQFIWGLTEFTGQNNFDKWQYLNWTGIKLKGIEITGLEPSTHIISIIKSSQCGIIHKNYFTTQLIN